MKNPYETMTDDELKTIYNDIMDSKHKGIRAESLVPYAKDIKENIGNHFTLGDAITWAKNDFFDEVAKRYFN